MASGLARHLPYACSWGLWVSLSSLTACKPASVPGNVPMALPGLVPGLSSTGQGRPPSLLAKRPWPLFWVPSVSVPVAQAGGFIQSPPHISAQQERA